MTSLEALQAVYERGERCRECEWSRTAFDTERLSGRAIVRQNFRTCDILDSQNYKFSRDPEDCPGVEDELARSEDA